MTNITEWLANLSITNVIIAIVVLIALRFALLATKTRSGKSAAEIAESLAIAMGLVFLIIRPFFVQAFFIPSESMVPTLLVHDHILVNKSVYIHRDPRPGEVVVFAAPPAALSPEMIEAKGQTDFIKRVAGVPGDTIYVVPSYVEVNGKKIGQIALRTIFEEYRSPTHVGVAYTYAIRMANPNQDIAGQVEQLKRLLARGETPGRDMDESYILGSASLGIEDGGPMIQLRNNTIYADGRKLTDKEVREYMPPGAKIVIHPGYIVRNGKAWIQPYLAEDACFEYPTLTPDPADVQGSMMVDNLKDAVQNKKIQLINKDGHLQVKLMPGEYLMMGDNRNNSSDGRYWGPLDRWRVKGRAMFIFFPLSRLGWVR